MVHFTFDDIPLYLASGAPITERQLQSAVDARAESCGLLVYHTHDSRRSAPGFPDSVYGVETGPDVGRIIIAEFKIPPNRVEPAQARWLRTFVAHGSIEVYVWTPQDWQEMADVLAGVKKSPGVLPNLPRAREKREKNDAQALSQLLRGLTGRRGRGLVR